MKDLTLPTPALPPLPAHDLYVDAFGELNPTDGRTFVMGNFYTAEQMQDYARAALSSHHEDGGRADDEAFDAELGRIAMRFVDRAGDVHPGIDDAETICAEFSKAMSDAISARFMRGPVRADVVALGGEPPCNPHPDAPHGYNRNASHNAGRYVCDCEGWAALGGEKGEAVAWLIEYKAPDSVPEEIKRVVYLHNAIADYREYDPAAKVTPLFAAPVGKARMPDDEAFDAELGRIAMRFVDRAGDVHPGIDDAETICAAFHKAMSDAIMKRFPSARGPAVNQDAQRGSKNG